MIQIKRKFHLLLVAVAAIACECVGSQASSDVALRELAIAFPNTIQIKKGAKPIIEFCPDNTCDAFVGTSKASNESMADFAYVFVYYFSEFYVLSDWRRRVESSAMANEVLSKPRYRRCKRAEEKETARCVLRQLGKKAQIEIYMVRYDEKKRYATRIKTP